MLEPLELKTFEERVLYYSLAWTWVWYLFGALYFVAPVSGWILFGTWVWRWVSSEQELPNRPMTPITMIWWLGMLVMLVALFVGHIGWDLGLPQLLKSSIGWTKGWALFAVFTLIGASLHVRSEVITRAGTIVILHTLILMPLFLVAPVIGLPGLLFVSPLLMLGGPGPEYFEVLLYNPSFDGSMRWRFYTPWPPAAAVAFGVLTPLVLRERSNAVKALGIFVVIAVVMMCKSRLGLIAIPATLGITAILSRLCNPRMLMIAAALALIGGLLGEVVVDFVTEQKERMSQMRADSSYVRDALGRLAVYRWATEAPVWGHGIVEKGPSFVEEMPIGSHHSWYGLLFVKGAVGFGALLLPIIFTAFELIAKCQKSRSARTGVSFLLLFTFFTFTENVEMLAYLIWPAFVMIGIASKDRMVNPFRYPLGQPRTSPALSPGPGPLPAV